MVVWETEGVSAPQLVASHYWAAERIWSDRPMPVASQAGRGLQVAMDERGNALAI